MFCPSDIQFVIFNPYLPDLLKTERENLTDLAFHQTEKLILCRMYHLQGCLEISSRFMKLRQQF